MVGKIVVRAVNKGNSRLFQTSGFCIQTVRILVRKSGLGCTRMLLGATYTLGINELQTSNQHSERRS